jgi:hypothetical protein
MPLWLGLGLASISLREYAITPMRQPRGLLYPMSPQKRATQIRSPQWRLIRPEWPGQDKNKSDKDSR